MPAACRLCLLHAFVSANFALLTSLSPLCTDWRCWRCCCCCFAKRLLRTLTPLEVQDLASLPLMVLVRVMVMGP